MVTGWLGAALRLTESCRCRRRLFLLLLASGCSAEPRAESRAANGDSLSASTAGERGQPPQVTDSAGTGRANAGERISRDSAFGLVHSDTTFEVASPTLLTTFPITGDDLDASEHAGDALGDYKRHLARAKPLLNAGGITMHVTNDAVLKWRDSLGVHSISTRENYAILYVFVRPDGRTLILKSGVQPDSAILAAARQHFGDVVPVRPDRSYFQ